MGMGGVDVPRSDSAFGVRRALSRVLVALCLALVVPACSASPSSSSSGGDSGLYGGGTSDSDSGGLLSSGSSSTSFSMDSSLSSSSSSSSYLQSTSLSSSSSDSMSSLSSSSLSILSSLFSSFYLSALSSLSSSSLSALSSSSPYALYSSSSSFDVVTSPSSSIYIPVPSSSVLSSSSTGTSIVLSAQSSSPSSITSTPSINMSSSTSSPPSPSSSSSLPTSASGFVASSTAFFASSGVTTPLGGCSYMGPWPSPSASIAFVGDFLIPIDSLTGARLMTDIANFYVARDSLLNLYNPGSSSSLQCGSISHTNGRRRLLQTTSTKYTINFYMVDIANSTTGLAQQFGDYVYQNGFNGTFSGLSVPPGQTPIILSVCSSGSTVGIGLSCVLTAPPSSDSNASSSNVTAGVVVGIVIGVVVGVLLLLALIWGAYHHHVQHKSKTLVRQQHLTSPYPAEGNLAVVTAPSQTPSMAYAYGAVQPASPITSNTPPAYSYTYGDAEPAVYKTDRVSVSPRAEHFTQSYDLGAFHYGQTSGVSNNDRFSHWPIGENHMSTPSPPRLFLYGGTQNFSTQAFPSSLADVGDVLQQSTAGRTLNIDSPYSHNTAYSGIVRPVRSPLSQAQQQETEGSASQRSDIAVQVHE